MANWLSVLLTILATVVMFGVLIFIHELGHYLTARLFHVTVKEFSVGMGPKIWQKTSEKTKIDYSLRALPIGGYVAMEGENEESNDPNAFYNKKVWQRMIVTVAGGAMNLLLGLILTVAYILSMPAHYGTTVTAFPEGAYSVASENALAVGDKVLEINGSSVKVGQELVYELFRAGGSVKKQVVVEENGKKRSLVKTDVLVLREGEEVLLHDVTFPVLADKGFTYGLRDFYYDEHEKSFSTTAVNVARQMRLSVKMVYESLYDLVTGKYGLKQLSGPVGTAEAVGEAIKQDVESAESGESTNSLLYLFMMISVNLGLFNLLPLPALDGGRLAFQVIELVRGKPVPLKYEGMVHTAGLLLMLALMAVVTFKDIFGLFG